MRRFPNYTPQIGSLIKKHLFLNLEKRIMQVYHPVTSVAVQQETPGRSNMCKRVSKISICSENANFNEMHK